MIDYLEKIDIDDLSYYWEKDVKEDTRSKQWGELVGIHASSVVSQCGIDIIELIESL